MLDPLRTRLRTNSTPTHPKLQISNPSPHPQPSNKQDNSIPRTSPPSPTHPTPYPHVAHETPISNPTPPRPLRNPARVKDFIFGRRSSVIPEQSQVLGEGSGTPSTTSPSSTAPKRTVKKRPSSSFGLSLLQYSPFSSASKHGSSSTKMVHLDPAQLNSRPSTASGYTAAPYERPSSPAGRLSASGLVSRSSASAHQPFPSAGLGARPASSVRPSTSSGIPTPRPSSGSSTPRPASSYEMPLRRRSRYSSVPGSVPSQSGIQTNTKVDDKTKKLATPSNMSKSKDMASEGPKHPYGSSILNRSLGDLSRSSINFTRSSNPHRPSMNLRRSSTLPVIPSPTTSEADTVSKAKSPEAVTANKSEPIGSPPPPQKPPKRNPSPKPQFSTADRTIFEELKRNIEARESQFVSKGPYAVRHHPQGRSRVGAGGGGGIGGMWLSGRGGGKHHPFAKDEVPYPRSYEREVVDLDVWETAWCQQLSSSLTWHVFDVTPTRVLDIGCGPGTWILNCARSWKHCHFVGLDIVPLQPDLQQIGWADLAARITWLQANFLEGIPFPNEEFDYVRIQRIARGVPEDKWDALLEEVTRVMKPGGAFEAGSSQFQSSSEVPIYHPLQLLEEDLFFPGKAADSYSDYETDVLCHTDRSSSDTDRTNPRQTSDTTLSFSDLSLQRTDSPQAINPPQRRDEKPEERSRSQIPPKRDWRNSMPEAALQRRPSKLKRRPSESSASSSRPLSTSPQSRNRALPPSPKPSQTEVRKSHHGPFHFNFHLPTRSPTQSNFTGPTPAAVSFLHTLGNLSGPGNASSADVRLSELSPSTPAGPSISPPACRTDADTTPKANSPTSPYTSQQATLQPQSPSRRHLLRTETPPPTNPRNHSLLEVIYNEMHASRFINLAPLSLLRNLLGLHFKDVRTHPPLIVTFPPLPPMPQRRRGRDAATTSSDSDSNSDILPVSPPLRKSQSMRSPTDTAVKLALETLTRKKSSPERRRRDKDNQDDKWLSMRSLIKGASPYVLLDETRTAAYSPSAFALHTAASVTEKAPSTSSQPSSPHAKSNRVRLPNTSLNFDLRTLNIHLALRSTEILACAEAMWDWVTEYQTRVRTLRTSRGRSGSINTTATDFRETSSARSATSVDVVAKNALVEMTRADFDGILTNFDLDMKDRIGLGSTLEERFHWPVSALTITTERKHFENACDKWEQYERRKLREDPYKRPDMGSCAAFPEPHDNAKRTSYSGWTTRKPRKATTTNVAEPLTSKASNPTRRVCRCLQVWVGWKA